MQENKKNICSFILFYYSQINCEQNLILTDLLNIQHSQNIFQAMSCLQIICIQLFVSTILCCWVEEEKIS